MSDTLLHRVPVFNRRNPRVKLTISGLLDALFFAPLGLLVDVVTAGEPLPGSRAAWLQGLWKEFAGVAIANRLLARLQVGDDRVQKPAGFPAGHGAVVEGQRDR